MSTPALSFHWDVMKLLILVALLAVSGFASSSETAFFSLNRFQIRRIRDRYRVSYERIRTLLSHPSRLLVLILLINEVTNVTISTLVTGILQPNVEILARGQLSPNRLWLITTFASLIVTLPLLLLFGEITPKVIAAKMNRLVAMVNSRILMAIYKLLFPLLWAVDTVISFMLRKLKAEGRDHLSKTMTVLSEEDFLLLMEEGHREGTVDPRERKLITNVFEFDDSTVAEVMTPIGQAFAVSATAKLADVLPEIRLQKFSRIPVYQKTKKQVVGILYVKDLLALKNDPQLASLEVRTIMSRPMVVGSNVHLSVLFRRFKEAKNHMAIVVNREAAGGIRPNAEGAPHVEEAIGVVTMEDVLESIFGEIADERDVR